MRHLWLNYCILLKVPMTHQSMFGGLQKRTWNLGKIGSFFAVPLGSLQFTSHRSPIVTMASHTVRAFMDANYRAGCSCFGIFFDIKEAFYRVIRQHAIHATCSDDDIMSSDDDIMKFLTRMGITDLHLEDVAQLYHDGPAIDSSNIHRDPWFAVRHDNQPVVTERGTCPGDGFADVLRALVFGRWIAQMEQDLYDLGIFQDQGWNGGIGLHSGPGSVPIKQSIVAWADDVNSKIPWPCMYRKGVMNNFFPPFLLCCGREMENT